MKPPVALKKPHTHEDHPPKFCREDPYQWMREKDSPEVLAMLQAENDYAEVYMAPHTDLMDKLFQEIKERVPQDDETVPVLHQDGWSYYSRIREGDQYRTYLRTRNDEHTSEKIEQVLLDLNEFAADHDFVELGDLECPRSNPSLMWYTIDLTGFREFQLRLRNLETGEDVPLRQLEKNPEFGRVSDFVLVEGLDDTMWLVVEDQDTKRPCSLMFWNMHAEPEAVMYESDEKFCMEVSKTSDHRYVMVSLDSHTSSEIWAAPALLDRDPETRPVVARRREREIAADHHLGHWFMMTNDVGINGRIVAVQDGRADPDPWVELVPHRTDVLLEEFMVLDEHLVVLERWEGVPRVAVYDIVLPEGTRASQRIKVTNRRLVDFGEHLIECGVEPSMLTGTKKARLWYESPITPRTVVEVDLGTLQVHVLKRERVLGDYDPSDYVCERIYALAHDAKDVPMTVYRRRDTSLDGTAPMWLSGYGAYGLSYELYFRPSEISLLNRGFVMGIAHVRGGSELGKNWHGDGRMANKMNTFRDFISCAEHAVLHKYTSMEKLCVSGGSAGGLLMGAVANMAPGLFQIVLNYVPFVDVLTTMQDREIPLTVGEYEEWGNPGILEQYQWMAEYSPIDNIESQSYPAMLVRTSYNDSQVMYWEPAKYVAKLRAHKRDDTPLLFKCDMGGGHGGSSGRFDKYRDQAFDYAFVLTALKIQ